MMLALVSGLGNTFSFGEWLECSAKAPRRVIVGLWLGVATPAGRPKRCQKRTYFRDRTLGQSDDLSDGHGPCYLSRETGAMTLVGAHGTECVKEGAAETPW